MIDIIPHTAQAGNTAPAILTEAGRSISATFSVRSLRTAHSAQITPLADGSNSRGLEAPDGSGINHRSPVWLASEPPFNHAAPCPVSAPSPVPSPAPSPVPSTAPIPCPVPCPHPLSRLCPHPLSRPLSHPLSRVLLPSPVPSLVPSPVPSLVPSPVPYLVPSPVPFPAHYSPRPRMAPTNPLHRPLSVLFPGPPAPSPPRSLTWIMTVSYPVPCFCSVPYFFPVPCLPHVPSLTRDVFVSVASPARFLSVPALSLPGHALRHPRPFPSLVPDPCSQSLQAGDCAASRVLRQSSRFRPTRSCGAPAAL